MSSPEKVRKPRMNINDDSTEGVVHAQNEYTKENRCSSPSNSSSIQLSHNDVGCETSSRLREGNGDKREIATEAGGISIMHKPPIDGLTKIPVTEASPKSAIIELGSDYSSQTQDCQVNKPKALKTSQLLPCSVKISKQRSCDDTDRSPTISDSGFDEKASISEDEREVNSNSEIQSIMEQFSEEGNGPGHEEVMSPRLEVAGPLVVGSIQHPPRKSSLEPLNSTTQSTQELKISSSSSNTPADVRPVVPLKAELGSNSVPSCTHDERYVALETPISLSVYRPPPPDPEPEPNLPFDFHRFLEQLRHRTADPVAKFLRSFLQEFAKKQWMVHEQVKIISDFLTFITKKMALCEVWSQVSDAEFENAREGMEKLVMNRLYTQTFSPAIPPPQPIQGSRPKRRGIERMMGPGRKGQHQEDVERDEILAQKVRIYGWVREEHLDIPPVAESGKRFLVLAQQELLKIKTYRAPRDKIICVLNCCKVIFGFLKHSKSDSSADSFMPLLIYVILQANPEHLVSNVQYILRFRNQEKLAGEAGYYLSSLLGAVQFIENLDRTTLTVTDEEFEKSVEAAVSAIAEKHVSQVGDAQPLTQAAPQQTDVTSRRLIDSELAPPNLISSNEHESANVPDEKAAMSGILRTIQRPLSSIGRIFSDEASSGPAKASEPSGTMHPPQLSFNIPGSKVPNLTVVQNTRPSYNQSSESAAAIQASAEAAMAHDIERAEHSNIVDTLAGMFPDLDREIIDDVVTQKKGRVGLAVDACLALSS
ncbi:hypothetical protein K3495_g5221 [Podosphaera aphanis]|nr:hypothetical protein K3495_g5221 [Podosphaera aphanis]